MNQLDRSNAFVDLVFRCGEGLVVIDECISHLERAEARHGLELIAPGLDYQTRPGPESDSACGIYVASGPWQHTVDVTDSILEDLLHDSLFPFLTELNAVLIPRYPDDSDIVFSSRHFLHATARAYAEIHAKWAREVRWLGKRNWNYVDFYYGQGIAEEYDDWVATLNQIVTEKTRRRCSSASSQESDPIK